MPELGPVTLKQLTSQTGFPRVSIHTQMVRAGKEVRQNRIRLTNAANEARDRLVALGVNERDAEAFVQPVVDLAHDDDQMEHQWEGLSLFLDETGYQTIRIPYALDERVDVGSRFSVTPLLEPAVNNDEYAVLALSQGGVGLYSCTRFTAEQVDLAGLPEDLCYVLRFDEYEKSGHVHTTSARGDSMHHGHGLGKDEHDAFVKQFVDAIEPTVTSWAREKQLPLVVIGADDVVGLYLKGQSYDRIVEEHRIVDPHSLSLDDIIRLGAECMQPTFTKRRDDAIARFHAAEHKAVDIYGVLSALVEGRVETLLLDPAQEIYGTVDPATESVHVDSEATGTNENLVDSALARALAVNANVVVVQGEVRTPAAILH
ncbi:MAG: hypothetical protein ACOC0E_00760 [Spirochaetota bacterium]